MRTPISHCEQVVQVPRPMVQEAESGAGSDCGKGARPHGGDSASAHASPAGAWCEQVVKLPVPIVWEDAEHMPVTRGKTNKKSVRSVSGGRTLSRKRPWPWCRRSPRGSNCMFRSSRRWAMLVSDAMLIIMRIMRVARCWRSRRCGRWPTVRRSSICRRQRHVFCLVGLLLRRACAQRDGQHVV